MSLINDFIKINDSFNDESLIDNVNTLVGFGIEAAGGSPALISVVDVDADSFSLDFSTFSPFGSTELSGYEITLSDLDFPEDPSLFISQVTTTSPDINISNTDDSITVDFSDSPYVVNIGEPLSFDFEIEIECFLTGTHILTDKGEVPVEELQIGDLVKTAEGKLEPIKWIGKQTIEPQNVTKPLRSNPILIKAGALGNGLPVRDLYTSPDHALYCDGLLINAGALVNNISILKTQPQTTFVYYHVELANHSLLVAEGTAAESYLPQRENREEYDNSAEYDKLYPHGGNLMLFPLDYPRISSLNKVPRYIKQNLARIAGEIVETEIQLCA